MDLAIDFNIRYDCSIYWLLAIYRNASIKRSGRLLPFFIFYGGVYSKGVFKRGRRLLNFCTFSSLSNIYIYRFMSEGNSFRSNVSGSEFKISSRYTCDSSGVVYLLGCKVCGKQYVGSTFTSFRVRFNNYKSASRRYSKGEVVTQADFFRHFTEGNHHGFMEDVSFQIIDRVFGESRHREGF